MSADALRSQGLQAAGVDASGLAVSLALPSAVSVCLVTPDGQRTMRTLLGCCVEQGAAALRCEPAASLLAGAQLLHIEGYALRRAGAALEAASVVSSSGGVVVLDLGDASVVRSQAAELAQLLATRAIELVFCNEGEAAAAGEALRDVGGSDTSSSAGGQVPVPYLGAAIEAGVARLLRHAAAVVVTRGEKGSVTIRSAAGGGGRFATPALPLGESLVDTTGCGDAHAAAFLWALLHGAPLPACAAAGAAAGAEAARVAGAALPRNAVDRLRALTSASAASASAASASAPARAAPAAGGGGIGGGSAVGAALSSWLFPPPPSGSDATPSSGFDARPYPQSATNLAESRSSAGLYCSSIDYSRPGAVDSDAEAAAAAAAAAAAGTSGTEVVMAMDPATGKQALMRRTASGTLTPAGDPGRPPPYADGRLHRSISSRVADGRGMGGGMGGGVGGESSASMQSEGDLIAASLPRCGGALVPRPGPDAGLAEMVAWWLGLGWLSAWVDSSTLFAAPKDAPGRMRKSMSSRVMAGA